MSELRALKFAAIGAVLVGAALWFAPPAPLVALLGAPAADSTTPPAETPPPAPEAASAGSVNPLETLKIEDFDEIINRPLFNPERAIASAEAPPQPDPEPQQPTPQPEPDVSASDFALLAIAGADEARIALVRFNKTNTVYHVRAGQYVSDWKVAALGTRDASLERGGTTLTLKLFAGASPRPGPAAPPPDATDPGADVPVDSGNDMNPNQPGQPDGGAADPTIDPTIDPSADPATDPTFDPSAEPLDQPVQEEDPNADPNAPQ